MMKEDPSHTHPKAQIENEPHPLHTRERRENDGGFCKREKLFVSMASSAC